jgi:hypothetical protein
LTLKYALKKIPVAEGGSGFDWLGSKDAKVIPLPVIPLTALSLE